MVDEEVVERCYIFVEKGVLEVRERWGRGLCRKRCGIDDVELAIAANTREAGGRIG